MLQDTHSYQDTQIGTYIIPGNLECQRVEFKLVMLVFKTLHGLARQYLVDDCQLVTCFRSTSTTIVRRQYVRHSTHPHSSRRLLLRCRWTTSRDRTVSLLDFATSVISILKNNSISILIPFFLSNFISICNFHFTNIS